jgi:hypothetical protein
VDKPTVTGNFGHVTDDFNLYSNETNRSIPYRADRGSISGQSVWDFLVDRVVMGMFFSEFFGIVLSVSFHRYSIFVYLLVPKEDSRILGPDFSTACTRELTL